MSDEITTIEAKPEPDFTDDYDPRALIESLTSERRDDLLFRLLGSRPGPLRFPDEPGAMMLPIMSHESIGVGACSGVTATCHAAFKLRRLVILEPTIDLWEDVDAEDELLTEYRTEMRGHWWWKKQVKVVAATRKIPRTRKVLRRTTIPRSSWSVTEMFVGAQIMFPSHNAIRGDAFGPSGTMDFDGVMCHPGIVITVSVRHDVSQSVPFYAVILGTRVEEERPRRPHPLEVA